MLTFWDENAPTSFTVFNEKSNVGNNNTSTHSENILNKKLDRFTFGTISLISNILSDYQLFMHMFSICLSIFTTPIFNN